ncbi:MAG: DUF5683 domain-containing protein [Gemmatimonadota bacterium]|nr:DUF5683 domain-containing protein [Gemmatimonadota bacterium]
MLKPSEVGSIPTHSRHFRAWGGAMAVAAWVLSMAALSSAAEVVEPPSPFARAVRSAVVPAWGQMTNDRPVKASVIFAVQAYLYTGILVESRRATDFQSRAVNAADAGTQAWLEDRAQEHFSRRRNLVFWSILGAFYSAVDAYIDAHLGDFEEDLEESRTLFAEVDPHEGTIAVGIAF